MSLISFSEHQAVVFPAGKWLADPHGQQRFVVPQLFSFVGDDPELKDVLCIKGGNTQHPCEMCLVPNDNLHNLPAVFPQRNQCDQVGLAACLP